jgi:hypothetical protein
MTLSHFFVVIVPSVALTFLFTWLQGIVGVGLSFQVRYWTSVPVACVAAIFLAWPLGRLFGQRPLMVFSGPCPTCKGRPPGWWHKKGGGKDRLTLLCGNCGQQVELWMTSRPNPNELLVDVPAYVLRSPQFLGVWRRYDPHIGSETAARSAGPHLCE